MNPEKAVVKYSNGVLKVTVLVTAFREFSVSENRVIVTFDLPYYSIKDPH